MDISRMVDYSPEIPLLVSCCLNLRSKIIAKGLGAIPISELTAGVTKIYGYVLLW